MAVRKFFLTFGQSNGGTIAPASEGIATDWENLHAGIAIAAGVSSPTYTQGGYNDLFVLPGTFPNHQVVDLKAKAVRGIRYLTPYNPTCTGAGNPQLAGTVEFYTAFPGTARILAGSTTSGLYTDRIWQHDPTGQTIVREATGTTHTITQWGVTLGGATFANSIAISPAFDPAPVTGEQITFQHVAGENSGSGNNAIVCLSIRYGYDWDGAGSGGWKGGLDGLQISCTAGTAANLVGTTGARTIKRIYWARARTRRPARRSSRSSSRHRSRSRLLPAMSSASSPRRSARLLYRFASGRSSCRGARTKAKAAATPRAPVTRSLLASTTPTTTTRRQSTSRSRARR